MTTTHACPPDGSGLTPCCGRTPFELPHDDRMTTKPDRVTCRSRRKSEPCHQRVSGIWVSCCEQGETDCECICHDQLKEATA